MCMHVHDTGVGFSERELSNLFQHNDNYCKTSGKNNLGSGIGLTVTRKLVEMNGGKIQYFSKGRNRGSVVVCSIKVRVIGKNSTDYVSHE